MTTAQICNAIQHMPIDQAELALIAAAHTILNTASSNGSTPPAARATTKQLGGMVVVMAKADYAVALDQMFEMLCSHGGKRRNININTALPPLEHNQ